MHSIYSTQSFEVLEVIVLLYRCWMHIQAEPRPARRARGAVRTTHIRLFSKESNKVGCFLLALAATQLRTVVCSGGGGGGGSA